MLAVTGAVAAGVLLLPQGAATAAPTPLTPPAQLGGPALPGPVVDAGKPSAQMTTMKATPDVAVAGTPFTLSASGLPANKDVSIVWMTANVTYILDARPDSVDYIGEKSDKFGVSIGVAKTDSTGKFSAMLKAPQDFGGLHDIYAVVDGVQVAKGGYLLSKTVKISPTKGPIGTPITITVNGLGSPTYERGGAVLYDNRFAGSFAGNWTRGYSKFVIRAAGPVGKHTVSIMPSSHTVSYLNIEQSPVPWQVYSNQTFTVTKDAGPPKAQVEWPKNVAATLDAKTTFATVELGGSAAAAATLSQTSGTVLSKVDVSATALTPNAPVDIVWSTVVGNRVTSIPLGNATTAADGTVKSSITIPDNLGGWHEVQFIQGGKVMAQAPFYVKRSFVSIAPLKVKAGKQFSVHFKGVGWTQLDNTLAVTYDNSYIGYGCGFNSNGDVVLKLVATGAPGTHLIDIYPLLYTQSPTYPYMPLAMVPLLSFANDAPGLALGYQLPAFRLAITVEK
jgi:hypothetical protein